MASDQWDGMSLAQKFHEIYERLAPSFGYETRPDTKDFNAESPNGKLMVAVCSAVAADLAVRVEAERVACTKAVSVVFDRYHKKSDPISQTMAAGVVMAESSIRARGPTPAYDAAIKAAYKEGWDDREGDFLAGTARIGINDAAIREAEARGMERAAVIAKRVGTYTDPNCGPFTNGLALQIATAIRAAKDQPA